MFSHYFMKQILTPKDLAVTPTASVHTDDTTVSLSAASKEETQISMPSPVFTRKDTAPANAPSPVFTRKDGKNAPDPSPIDPFDDDDLSTSAPNAPRSAFDLLQNADEDVFVSDGLRFRVLPYDISKAEVIGLDGAATASHVIVPCRTTQRSLEVARIAENAFKGDIRLHTLTLPVSVTEIGESAFESSMLRNINLFCSVSRIGRNAFRGCGELREANLAETRVESLPDSVFAGCANLERLKLPKKLLRIGAHAFEHCFSLSSVVLPETLETVEEGAFSRCNSLKTVSFEGNALNRMASDAFAECTEITTIETNQCDFAKYNAHLLFRDSALYRKDDHNVLGSKIFLDTLIDTTPGQYYHYNLSIKSKIIGSFALMKHNYDVVSLSTDVELLMPNALVRPTTEKALNADGMVTTVKTLGIRDPICYEGTIEEWHRIAKLPAERLYSVVVKCKDGTIIDRI